MYRYFWLITILCFICCNINNRTDGNVYLNDYSRQQTVYAKHGGVSSIHPLASKVGIEILKQGGNAVDAAIAVQFALAVVYPEAGNIGGGGFMVMRLADGTARALDFREKAPAAAHKNMYIDSAGNLNVEKSLEGHLASGVPGTIAGIFEMLRYAKLPLKKLIDPAIALAEKGYSFQADINARASIYNTMPNVYDGRIKYKEGDVILQTDLSNTLKRIRDKGPKDFYEGVTAKLIVAEMKRGGGAITMNDLKNYKAKWRKPQQFDYRGYEVISMSLPSSGGILLNQMLKMIEPFPISSYGAGSVAAISLMVEAERRAYRDRAAYLGDADYVEIPVQKLVSNEYLIQKMADYNPAIAGTSESLKSAANSIESKQTTHFSVIDKEGNAVSVTTTLNMPYGSGIIVGGAGFFLNNEMNDFNIKTGTFNASGGVGGIFNSIAPGKRMLSSMTPTIILKNGALFMALGTPGGTTIPTSVFQTIVNVIDFNMTATQAVIYPKFHHEWMPDVVYMSSKFPQDTIQALIKKGYNVKSGGRSFLEVIRIDEGGEKEIVSQMGSAEGY